MAITIDKATCIGCGNCLPICPVGAIALEDDGKASISAACVMCGACIGECPVAAISREASSQTAPVQDLSQWQDVWVFAEQQQGRVREVAFELLGVARKLADDLGQRCCAVLLGSQLDDGQAQALVEAGADVVYVLDHPDLATYQTDPYAEALCRLAREKKPNAFLIGATADGRDLAPRVACELDTGLCADCTELGVSGASGLVEWTRPAFGGNIMATILCPQHRPQMGTVRPKLFRRPDRQPGRTGIIERLPCEALAPSRTTLEEVVAVCGESCRIEEAEVICAGGRGMCNAENFALLQELADLLGGAVAGSRAVTDVGWLPHQQQVGQSGKTVSPRLYFACGISGAVQHVAGMSGSDTIIAINKDPQAPIFKAATYGIVGDVRDVLPQLILELKKAKGLA